MYGHENEQMNISQSPNPEEKNEVEIDEEEYETSQHNNNDNNNNNNKVVCLEEEEGISISGDDFVGDYSISRFGVDENQLTLSFRGQVYVFDSVTPDKVQSVLLVLGGNSVSPPPPPPDNAIISPRSGNAFPTSELSHLSHGGVLDYAKRCNHLHREASLHRFRQKRKQRCFDKKIRYDVRQEVALKMHRKKGQFTSRKSDDSSGCNGQDSGLDETHFETSCTHCRISSKSTPMMRRGPHGPRTLCNACGLFWANKGTLRELTKKQDLSQLSNELDGASPYRGTDMLVETKPVDFGEGENSKLIAQH